MEQKNGRRPKHESAQLEEQYQNRKERVQVSVPIKHQNLPSTLNFEWPEFTSEKERIKNNSKQFEGKSIPEAFGVTVKLENLERYDNLRELRLGDSLDVIVTSISDNSVTFETVATKQVIQSSINLKKYLKLRYMTPFKATAVVTKADRETAYIDIIKPMYEKWLKDVLKNPELQRNMKEPKIITVKNLQLTRGGFLGQAVIPVISDYVGQEYTVEAFIPGSQIVINIEDNFEKWNGKSVETFVTNYIQKPGTKNDMSLVCSRKEYLKLIGDINVTNMFNAYCEDKEEWNQTTQKIYNGVVTGIINSSKKHGVFVEIPELYITGMVEMDAEKLVNYKPQTKVQVQFNGFEENIYYDSVSGQLRHDAPYEIEDDILKSCNVKPTLKLV